MQRVGAWASSFCRSWLVAQQPSLSAEAFSALGGDVPLRVAQGFRGMAAAARTVTPTGSDEASKGRDLPPSWQPPPNNPVSLKPQHHPTLAETLAAIAQAPDPLALHNAYRRRPSHLPPAIAAAKLKRLAQLMSTSYDFYHPALPRLVREITVSWDVLLQLYTAADLAACVRASCESGVALDQDLQRTPASSPARNATHGSAGAGQGDHAKQQGGEGVAPAGVASEGLQEAQGEQGVEVEEAPRGACRGLVRRSLAVLLDQGGRELRAAGPGAVVDVAAGLQAVGYTGKEEWAVVLPLLEAAKGELGEGPAGQAAQEALDWAHAQRL